MESHPVQLTAIGLACALDVIGLVLLNRHKAARPAEAAACTWSWAARRNAYWLLIGSFVVLAVALDVYYPIGQYALAVKAYAFAFPLGLLDLYFSQTRGVPLKVLLGATLWCSTVLLRQRLVNAWYGGAEGLPPFVLRELSPRSLLIECVRYVAVLVGVGLLSDLLFSPLHRLAHHPRLYRFHHKEHHQYTNHLTALVLYHGALLDDFLMPFTTLVGGFLYVLLLGLAGLEAEAFSNVSGYLVIYNTLLSHAHDVRCSRLLAPLPDSLNFVAYHYVHHLSPSNNYGLTKPSDLLWDWLLGVRTIRKIEEVVSAKDA